MTRKNIGRKLIVCEAIGFGILIAISWFNELVGLPAWFFGGTQGANLHEAFLESFAVLAVAVPTALLTFALSKRLFYLEGFVRVCAWCRKVGVDDHWVPMEHFFAHELKTKTSHGMCPECVAKFERELLQRSPP